MILDSAFLVDFEREARSSNADPATRFTKQHADEPLMIIEWNNFNQLLRFHHAFGLANGGWDDKSLVLFVLYVIPRETWGKIVAILVRVFEAAGGGFLGEVGGGFAHAFDSLHFFGEG